ncbi:hypothetical protein DQ04_15341000 [Trypanosoma grayi]|uniref:hypothetical protein n=1 Tax=Trypanosoma grayi TaxID=71804 RepID=UPI0004F4635A|nr:hypothetical protein DQ04_15341000 [Trypanosoma grayi]KEG06195.1 hypothetical protein DQ04_15341000 [Trypanosoma grayi]
MHVGNDNDLGTSPMLLPVSTALIGMEQQQAQQLQAMARHAPLRAREMEIIPTYQEVMLGLGNWSGEWGGGGGRMMPAGRVRTSAQQRDRQQRRSGPQQQKQQRLRVAGGEDGAGHTAQSTAAAGAAAQSVTCASFNLFSAEECRKRLHRLLQFIAAYTAQRRKRGGSSAAVAAVVGGEASFAGPITDTSPGTKKAGPPSPRMQLQNQSPQQLTPSREKAGSKQNVSPIRGEATPLMLPQSVTGALPSVGKLPGSPSMEVARPQHRHHHHHPIQQKQQRRRRRSRSAHAESSGDSDQEGRSPVIAGDEAAPCSLERSRAHSSGDRRGDSNNNSNTIKGEEAAMAAPSSRSSSAESSSSNRRRWRRRRV